MGRGHEINTKQELLNRGNVGDLTEEYAGVVVESDQIHMNLIFVYMTLVGENAYLSDFLCYGWIFEYVRYWMVGQSCVNCHVFFSSEFQFTLHHRYFHLHCS